VKDNRLARGTATMLILFSQIGCASSRSTSDGVKGTALSRLKAGNARFAEGAVRHPHLDARLRHDLAAHGQHPFATVLSCSDSRVPVELLFDQGVGDLFVIRVAGNVVGQDEAGSIEYAVEHLHCPLLVVLGHRKCGAVTAAVKMASDTPNIEGLIKHIVPAVRAAREVAGDVSTAGLVDEAVRHNVWQSIAELIESSDLCRQAVRSGELAVVGAVYDIDSGDVAWLGRHPRESTLLQ